MCGICGELRFDGASPDMDALRGPDHEGYYRNGALAFGHRGLSIIDLSSHASRCWVRYCLVAVLMLFVLMAKS